MYCERRTLANLSMFMCFNYRESLSRITTRCRNLSRTQTAKTAAVLRAQTMPRDEKFPRSDSLPAQSPLFWVEQKDRYLRQLLIRDIEEHTGRRLVVYFANRYENAQIEPRDSTFIAELLGDINNEAFDL